MSKPSKDSSQRSLTSLHGETWFLVHALMQALRPYFAAITEECGLTMQQATALRLLSPQTPPTMSDLANAIGCDTANLTGVIDRLEKVGLVERRSADQDRRVKLLWLTHKGLHMREQLIQKLEHASTPIAKLSAHDQRLLHDLLLETLHLDNQDL